MIEEYKSAKTAKPTKLPQKPPTKIATTAKYFGQIQTDGQSITIGCQTLKELQAFIRAEEEWSSKSWCEERKELINCINQLREEWTGVDEHSHSMGLEEADRIVGKEKGQF